MAKKKRPKVRAIAGSPERREPTGERRASPDWRWRTFPVFFAFVVGLLAASFINGRPNNDVAAAVQIAALAGVGFGVAHLFVTNVVVAGRVKRRNDAIARGETPAEDLEDELVYPDDAPTSGQR
jgi:hypothetical protein